MEAAIRAIAATRLSPETESMLRVFLCFSAIHRDGTSPNVDGNLIRKTVQQCFTLLPTPEGMSDEKYKGTIRLQGLEGSPKWMNNDSYRGSFQNQASRKGRVLFVDEEWHGPLREDAVDRVAATMGGPPNKWPPRDALAALLLNKEEFDPALEWPDIEAAARSRVGVDAEDWEKITSDPVLEVEPFADNPWDPEDLPADLLPPGLEPRRNPEGRREEEELPEHLRGQVDRVIAALEEHGDRAIVALAGVPGTSKSHTARRAAQEYADEGCLREIQFSPGYTYEEFMEGPRFGEGMEFEVVPGAFLDLNEKALINRSQQYVLLIEELTRADIPRVLGELLTYVEYRGDEDEFNTLYRRDETTRIAPNLAILATYNPTDSSAVNVDAALLRRMRVLDFPPSVELLGEILDANGLDAAVIEQLATMFDACKKVVGEERFAEQMPFGHAVFASVVAEEQLHPLWHEELKRILVRPHTLPHELYDTILENYPWASSPDKSLLDA